MTLTAMPPDFGLSKGREMSLWSVSQASIDQSNHLCLGALRERLPAIDDGLESRIEECLIIGQRSRMRRVMRRVPRNLLISLGI